ncbi:MAG TPA: response regulator transcription factor [Pilimelia sp.]|nr:response regulator transcription factor [Pilimelia sp.]
MVVDDQPVVRGAFAAVVGAEPELAVVGEAADGAAAVHLAGSVAPDVVLMDIRMPGMDGLTATRLLAASCRVLVLTTFDLDAYLFEAMRAGASGFLLKDARPEELVHAIRVVAAGDALLAPTVTRRLIDAFAAGTVEPPPPPSPTLDGLTGRETDVLRLIAQGRSNQEIADALRVTTGTVKTHVNALLGKLGVRDRLQAAIRAYETGLVRPASASPPAG